MGGGPAARKKGGLTIEASTTARLIIHADLG